MSKEDVEIVKMEAAADDVPPAFDVKVRQQFEILITIEIHLVYFLQVCLSMYWLPKSSKTPKSYNGGHDFGDFIKYIAKEATDELKGWDRNGEKK